VSDINSYCALSDAILEPTSFDLLEGWAQEDHHAAFKIFLKSATAIVESRVDLRPARPTPNSFRLFAEQALKDIDTDPRLFFETRFTPFFVRPRQGRGFLTGYYEPEISGSLTQSSAFPVPVLGRPHDLVSFHSDQAPPEFASLSLSAARQTANGLEPYFDRAAIEDGVLQDQSLALLYLPDRVELFFAQVQGSARVRLPDGRLKRLTYAGRNGHPYTTIAKVIREEGHMALEEINLGSLKAWLRAHPQDAKRIMRLNRSYIFFSLSEDLAEEDGPIGAASLPLTAGRSIAVDRHQWCYGLPFYIRAQLPDENGNLVDFSRLMVAQDTGSAILGAPRADLFMGSGERAGHHAGLIRHPGDFVVLLPKA
jgi:membrane-bound lytic murein transglycosylase A